MPVLIDEVIAEVSDASGRGTEADAPAPPAPLTPAEQELAEVLALVEERRARLRID